MSTSSITPPNKQLPDAAFRHWIHSREEDRATVEVYRPAEFPFPPSFGRDGFELRGDGTFVQDVVGPADGIIQVPGRWKQIGLNQVGVRFASPRHPDYAFEILEVDESVLRLRLLAVAAPHTERGDPALESFDALPPSGAWRRIDFSQAAVRTLRSYPPQHLLVVSGLKPYFNMDVELVPVIYIKQPEYWEIEVVGRLRGLGLPTLTPYTATLRLDGNIGTRGVEVAGATRRLRIDVLSETETETDRNGASAAGATATA